MEIKQELVGTSFRKARAVLAAIDTHGITPDMSEEAIEELVMNFAKAKVVLKGGKLSDYIKGQEWYVNSLVEKSRLEKREIMKLEYDELNIENSSFDELAAML